MPVAASVNVDVRVGVSAGVRGSPSVSLLFNVSNQQSVVRVVGIGVGVGRSRSRRRGSTYS